MPAGDWITPGDDARRLDDADDMLILLFLCCHPALSPASQIATAQRRQLAKAKAHEGAEQDLTGPPGAGGDR